MLSPPSLSRFSSPDVLLPQALCPLDSQGSAWQGTSGRGGGLLNCVLRWKEATHFPSSLKAKKMGWSDRTHRLSLSPHSGKAALRKTYGLWSNEWNNG